MDKKAPGGKPSSSHRKEQSQHEAMFLAEKTEFSPPSLHSTHSTDTRPGRLNRSQTASEAWEAAKDRERGKVNSHTQTPWMISFSGNLPIPYNRPSPGFRSHFIEKEQLSSSKLSNFISHLIEWEPRATQAGLHKLSQATAHCTKSEVYFPLWQVLPQKITSRTRSLPLQIGARGPPVPQPENSGSRAVIMGLPEWTHQPSSCSGSFPRG